MQAFNEITLEDPSMINQDNYGRGWLFDLQCQAELWTVEQYVEALAAGWNQAQRQIREQMD